MTTLKRKKEIKESKRIAKEIDECWAEKEKAETQPITTEDLKDMISFRKIKWVGMGDDYLPYYEIPFDGEDYYYPYLGVFINDEGKVDYYKFLKTVN